MRSSLFFLYRSSSAPELSTILQRAKGSCQLASEGQTGRYSCCQFHSTDQTSELQVCSYHRHILSSQNTLLIVLMQLIMQVQLCEKIGQHEAMQCQADKPCKSLWMFTSTSTSLPVQVQDGVWLIAHDLDWRRFHRYCWQRPVHCTNMVQVKTCTLLDCTLCMPEWQQQSLPTSSKSNESSHISDRYKMVCCAVLVQ